MGNSKFTPHSWQHKCPAKSVEDGDNAHSGHPNMKNDKIGFFELNLGEGSRLENKGCSVDGCKYKVNEETVILNKDGEEIRTFGGKNLYSERTRAYNMRCCKLTCRNRYTMGHSLDNSNFDELWNHCCTHAFDYQYMIKEYGIKKRLPGCTCVMLNTYKEEVEFWEPDGQPRVPVPGGPLDLDKKYRERKETRDLLSAAEALKQTSSGNN